MTLEKARERLEPDGLRLLQDMDGQWVVYGEHPKYGYPVSKTGRCATWQAAYAAAMDEARP